MSLDGAYDPDNIFARIIRGEIPSVKVFEDERVLAFMDVYPQSEGHVLVISKASTARNLLECEPEVVAELAQATRRVARAVRKALNPDGIMISQFNGAAAGQTIYHLHFHVIPRWEGRPLKGHAQAPMAEPGALKATAAKIAAAL